MLLVPVLEGVSDQIEPQDLEITNIWIGFGVYLICIHSVDKVNHKPGQ
jgi:hypothetical protein